MGFGGKYYYGREICRDMEHCLTDEEQYASFVKGVWQVAPAMMAFIALLSLSLSLQNGGMKAIMKLFGALNIQASQAFFYKFF